jgi:hypothetical protein
MTATIVDGEVDLPDWQRRILDRIFAQQADGTWTAAKLVINLPREHGRLELPDWIEP